MFIFLLYVCSGFRNKEYNKVEDLYDTRIPLHNEDVFEHGLRFKSKVRLDQNTFTSNNGCIFHDVLIGILVRKYFKMCLRMSDAPLHVNINIALRVKIATSVLRVKECLRVYGTCLVYVSMLVTKI